MKIYLIIGKWSINMKKLFCSILLLIFSSNIMAWDEKEQNALMGFIAGIAALNFYLEKQKNRSYNPQVQNNGTMVADCQKNPYKDNPGAAKAWEKGCLDRFYSEQSKLEQEAYNQGYNNY